MSTTEFFKVDIRLITPSLTNPRKNFNGDKLQELADDIKRRGLDTPITVRPLPGSRVADTDRSVQYELVCGERRLRASGMAGLTSIPALLRALTDEQALEIQICENLQSEDLSELEEAEGYERLMQIADINADQVGERIGKSRSYVYARLKLLDLCPEARNTLREGKIDASRALLVARIPNHKLQIEAVTEILKGITHWSPDGSTTEPLSYRSAQVVIHRKYMLKLNDARFDIARIDLVPEAGSCKTCTKRTGYNPDLFTDLKGADMCTDPPCYHTKEAAHDAAVVKAAKDKGQTVIVGKEAKELLANNSYNGKITGYRRLDSAEDSPTDKPLRALIGAIMKAEGIKPILIEGGKPGDLVECLPNEVALRLIKAAEKQVQKVAGQDGGKAMPKTATKEIEQLVKDKKAKAEAKAQAQYEQQWRAELVAATWREINAVDGMVSGKVIRSTNFYYTPEVHRYIARRAINNLSHVYYERLCELLELGKVAAYDALIDYTKDTPHPHLLNLLILMQQDSAPNDHAYLDHVPNEGLMLVARTVWEEDLDHTIEKIKREVKAKIWPKPQRAKTPSTQDPAALAVGERGGTKDKKTGGKKPVARAKQTEEEARLGIANAMQGLEGSACADALAPPTEPVQTSGDDQEYLAAVKVVVSHQNATVRLLKDELGIGTTKALKIMARLEQDGKVSPCNERGVRKVLVAA